MHLLFRVSSDVFHQRYLCVCESIEEEKRRGREREAAREYPVLVQAEVIMKVMRVLWC